MLQGILCRVRVVAAGAVFIPGFLFAQAQAPRILTTIDDSQRLVLRGNTHPLARAEFDRGMAPDSLPMDRILLVLKRSPEQDAALHNLLKDQQDPASANFHKWLTPEDFGHRFGPAEADIAEITSWLQARGFRLGPPSKGRTVIEFSGTAGQVRQTFHTTIHKFQVNGVDHWANATDPAIPAALSPVVEGISTLHNFTPRSMAIRDKQPLKVSAAQPSFTSGRGNHYLGPGDYAVAYNINPVYKSGITGKGATIGIVGPTNFDPQNIEDFRKIFGLSVNPPQIIINGDDPGVPFDGSDGEAILDATWSGAIAPDATIKFVVSADTYSSSGIDLSELYLVDNNLADVITESIGVCEYYAGKSFARRVGSIREQAAAQGITYLVSSGDGGAYGCDDFNSQLAAKGPVSVNVLASSPYVVAVGGTQFNENGNPSKYWTATNQKTTYTSLLSYIPENVWNESCDSNLCFPNIIAGSGGVSTIVSKPAWQAGVPGIPNDGMRDLPDISLTASGHDPYAVCFQYSCMDTNDFGIYGFSGTSASTPSFAGIVALIVQKTGVRQGAINSVLYRLSATQQYSQCNGSSATSTLASNCIFNDTTIGNNTVAGAPGFDQGTGLYQAGLGYDLATGLGSVNVANLVNQWNSLGSKATSTALTVTPATLVHGSAATVGITVTSATGTPTGDVSLLTSASQGVARFTLSQGSVNASTGLLAGGTYNVSAHYAGDTTYAPSDSAPVSVTVTPEASLVTTRLYGVDPLTNQLFPATTFAYGDTIVLSTTVAGSSGFGAPGGTVNYLENGKALATNPSQIAVGGGIFTAFPGEEAPALGAHSLVSSYSGDASFSPSTSSAVPFTVQQGATFSIMHPSHCLPAGSPTNLKVSVLSSGYGITPTGTATFSAGGKSLGSAVTLDKFGRATLSTTALTGSNNVTATYSGDSNYTGSSDTEQLLDSTLTCVADVEDGAGYYTDIALDSIVSLFGNKLASAVALPTSAKLPTSLGGVTIIVKDSAGTTQPIFLSYVGPDQINAVLPAGLQTGPATLQLTSASGTDSVPLMLYDVAPGLFSANAQGDLYAAANLVRVKSDGTQSIEPIVSVDSKGNISPVPIAFHGDRLVLVLYGTGIRKRSSLDNALVYFNGQAKVPVYAGDQTQYYGLDQVNVELPPSLAGAGDVEVYIATDGVPSNSVLVNFQ